MGMRSVVEELRTRRDGPTRAADSGPSTWSGPPAMYKDPLLLPSSGTSVPSPAATTPGTHECVRAARAPLTAGAGGVCPRRRGRRWPRRHSRQADVHRQQRLGIEPGIDRRQVAHRLNHQAGADHQHDGQRHFGDHQPAAKPLRPGAVAASCRLPEPRAQIDDASLPPRCKADDDAAQRATPRW